MPVIENFKNKKGKVPTNAEVCEVMYKHLHKLKDSNEAKDRALLAKICGNCEKEIIDWLDYIHTLPDDKTKNRIIGETLLPIK